MPVLTSKASLASAVCLFSSFGLTHSTLKNQLGNKKASKVAFMFKILRNLSRTDSRPFRSPFTKLQLIKTTTSQNYNRLKWPLQKIKTD